jgi:hypothetical protein
LSGIDILMERRPSTPICRCRGVEGNHRSEHRQGLRQHAFREEHQDRRRQGVLDIELGYPAKSQIDGIRKRRDRQTEAIPGVGNVEANVTSKIVAHAVQRGVKLIPRA